MMVVVWWQKGDDVIIDDGDGGVYDDGDGDEEKDAYGTDMLWWWRIVMMD